MGLAIKVQRLAHPHILTIEDETSPSSSSTSMGPKSDQPKSLILTWIDPQPPIIEISSSESLLTPTPDQLQATSSVNQGFSLNLEANANYLILP
ncbi:hypothetical protein PanWU01x14_104780 [Parasponia andersonii]|uniref:Uncharacterized protein n=1 Tax=Parasponia andersonii TaxID=3476 RepID=A0A2P5D1Z9_PARAD|nr:hypothetical protein PanWU01x14_104780 [Parasponia andersonii]